MLFERSADVHRHHIDSRDVEAHHSDTFNDSRRYFRMNEVRDIGRRTAGTEIRVTTDQHDLSGGGNRLDCEALFSKNAFGDFIEPKLTE